jgi:hypothetical protein
MDWTPVPHVTVQGTFSTLAFVLDLGLFVLSLGALVGLVLLLQSFGRAFTKGFREEYHRD